jgi:hypothetical protein
MSPHGIMPSKKACNSPGLHPVKGQKPSLGTHIGSLSNQNSVGRTVSHFCELGWLVAVPNMIHSLAVQAGIRSKVLEAVTMPTTALNVVVLLPVTWESRPI